MRTLPLASASLYRVLVVEDFRPFRQYVVSILAEFDSLLVICDISDGLEAVQKAKELKPDLIFLDVNLPPLNGVDAARQIRKLLPNARNDCEPSRTAATAAGKSVAAFAFEV